MVRNWKSGRVSLFWGVTLALGVGLGACAGTSDGPPPRNVNVYQDWGLQPGDRVANYSVHSGLGDVAIELRGNRMFMPFDGQVQPASGNGDRCVIISSAEVPAYLFRVCGLTQVHLGDRRQTEPLGRGDVVAFATLRRQADGTWAMVEPAQEMLANFLEAP